MIKYSLKCVEENCNKNEPFDGWFQNSASFEKQIDSGYISCPYCGSLNIKKNLMSPSVKSTKKNIPKIISKNVKHNELNKTANKTHFVYIIKLKKNPKGYMYYRGMTGLHPYERYLNHIRGYKSNKMVKKYHSYLDEYRINIASC